MFSQRFLLRVSVLFVSLGATSGWFATTQAHGNGYDITPIHGNQHPREAKIRETLNQNTTLEFNDTSLEDILKEIETSHQLQIKIDQRALDDFGVDKDSPITIKLQDISLRSALDLILDELDLTYVIESEVLQITSIEEAETKLELVIYPVNDLLPEGPFDHKDLIHLMHTTVSPTSWDEVGGPGTIMGFRDAIVVNQTEQVHEEIYEFLQGLRQLTPYEGRAHSKAATKGGGSF